MLKVHKFGGSSVATAEKMQQVADIIANFAKKEQCIIVVSALRGITDQLLEVAKLAEVSQQYYKEIYRHIVDRHHTLFDKLIGKNDPVAAKQVDKLLHDLYRVLHSIQYLHVDNLNVLDLTASFGEQLSATIFAAYLNLRFPARYVDARKFMITDNHFSKAHVLYDETSNALQSYFESFFQNHGEFTIPVVTGFIGTTKDGHTTTLGRDGSNYTAAVLGTVLNAKAIEIWSDVDGVYSADPKLIPTSIPHRNLSYSEAEELSNFRAKVVCQAVIPQLVAKHIPISIKNTFNPTALGTQISLQTKHNAIKNVSVVHDLLLITMTSLSPHQLTISHLTERIFRVLSLANINFILITQTSSMHDMCFGVKESDIVETERIIGIEFLYEIQQHLIAIKKIRNQSIIALVGNGIKQALGAFGRVLIALENNHIKLNGFAHGTAECNISLILNSNQSHKALKVVHHSVFENTPQNEHNDANL